MKKLNQQSMVSMLLTFMVLLLSFESVRGQIISQYIETNSGTTPKGIEVWNNTGSTLDFGANNLVVQKGANGGALSSDYTVSSGTLAEGAVIVIGTSDMQATAEGNGATFYEKAFTFNGNDALAITCSGVTTDVFGTPGVDPGSDWSGNGVSTANQNIQLKTDITTGDTDGWTDPSERFESVSTDPVNDMTGFGIAPASSSSTTLEFTTGSATVDENSGTYSLSLNITNPDATSSTSCDVALTTGNSADINNYTIQSVTFPAGSSGNQEVQISITDDDLVENDEVLTFSIQNITGGNSAGLGSQGSFNLTINDNDYPNAWINEFHYDNSGTDANEGVEIILEDAGSYTLGDFQVDLYNGSGGASYDSQTLDNFTTGSTTGGFTFYYWMVTIQNGDPDGLALSYNSTLIPGQFLSYGGSLSATDGPASGETSTDIGVTEGSGTSTQSLQLTGSGTQYSDFTWTEDLEQTWGSPNNGGDQSLPVTLSQWEASSKNGAVQLTWTTDSEIENLGFIIDRALTEKGPWRQIADFNSHAALKGQGSTNSVTAYSFTDEAVAVGETYYYRLSDVDYKGTRTEHDAISVTVSDKDQNALPGGFQLEKIFPNPFNPSVTIDFTVVEPTAITVNVFDLQGRLVQALIEQHYTAGNYQIQWNGLSQNGRPAPSGIYLLQIRDEASILVRKVILAR